MPFVRRDGQIGGIRAHKIAETGTILTAVGKYMQFLHEKWEETPVLVEKYGRKWYIEADQE